MNLNIFAILACIILVFHGFSNVFAVSTFGTIPFCAEVLYFVLLLLYNIKIKMSIYTAFLICLFVLLLVSLTIQTYSTQVLDHESVLFLRMQMFTIIHSVVYFEILKRFGVKYFFKLYLIGFFLIVVYGGIDFLLSNLVNIHLDKYIPRNKTQLSTGTIGTLYRIRSVFEEPGYYAHYLNVAFPLLLIVYREKNFKILFVSYIVSLLLTFSVTGIIVSLAVLTVKLVLFSKRFLLRIIFGVVMIGLIVGINDYLKHTDNVILRLMYKKMLFSETDGSARDRAGRYDFAWKTFNEVYVKSIPAVIGGLGNGYFKSSYATIGNLYLMLLLENGVVVVVVFICFVIFCLVKTIKMSGDDSRYRYLSCSIIATLLHYLLIQYPCEMGTWLPFILLSYFLSCGKNDLNRELNLSAVTKGKVCCLSFK